MEIKEIEKSLQRCNEIIGLNVTLSYDLLQESDFHIVNHKLYVSHVESPYTLEDIEIIQFNDEYDYIKLIFKNGDYIRINAWGHLQWAYKNRKYVTTEDVIKIMKVLKQYKEDGNESGFLTDGNKLLMYIGNEMRVKIPEGITDITSEAFKSTDIITIDFPDSLRNIWSSAFENCKVLQNINLNKTQTIFLEAFKGCYSIENLVIPKTVSFICSNAFELSEKDVVFEDRKNCKLALCAFRKDSQYYEEQ